MSLPTKTKRVLYGAVAIILLVVGFMNKGKIAAKFSFLTKKVAEVKQLKQADASTDEGIRATVTETVDYKIPFHQLPSSLEYRKPKKKVKGEGIMWNAHASMCEANGGKFTKTGSYFAELGQEYNAPFVLELGRQDDYSKQQDNLVTFIREYIKNKETDKGTAFTWIMGDNWMAYAAQLNRKLESVEKEFNLKKGSLLGVGFVASGYSYGEDKFMGPAEWVKDPNLAKGCVIACVKEDGDQNLAIQWATDNGLLINPDPTTYCKEAINFSYVDGFMEAANAWGTMTGERDVVTIDPKTLKTVKTGEKISVKILGGATWTPGDEVVYEAAKRENVDIVGIFSTYDNPHQMPCLIITINKFYDENPEIIDAITEGIVRASDQIKVFPQTFDHAMKCMAEVYPAKTAEYWAKYFKGFQKPTASGTYQVSLGGTRVVNLADNLDEFGVGEGARGTFKSSYEKFGGYIHELFPADMPELLPYFKTISINSLERVAAKMKKSNEITKPMVAEFASGPGKMTEEKGHRAYKVTFATGKASLTPSGEQAMEEMFTDLNTHDLRIKIHGYTDNVVLMKQIRYSQKPVLKTVYNWLHNRNAKSFPQNRFDEVVGFGPKDAVADNSTEDGRSQNRRVEIIVGH